MMQVQYKQGKFGIKNTLPVLLVPSTRERIPLLRDTFIDVYLAGMWVPGLIFFGPKEPPWLQFQDKSFCGLLPGMDVRFSCLGPYAAWKR